MADEFVPVDRVEIDDEVDAARVSRYEERPDQQLADDEITDREEGFLRGYDAERERLWGDFPSEEYEYYGDEAWV